VYPSWEGVPFSAMMTRIQHFNLITIAVAVELH
jgi:hypothetical protein